jgi:hypothetical protein
LYRSSPQILWGQLELSRRWEEFQMPSFQLMEGRM